MVPPVQSTSRDTTDLLRALGGVLLAAGCVTLFARKTGHEAWGDFPLLLIVLIPAVLLYVLAVVGADQGFDAPAESWRSVLLVTSILLAPLVLVQLLQTLGIDEPTALEVAAVFVVTAMLAAYGASRGRVRYAVLLAGLASLVTWVIVWVRVLHPGTDMLRVVFIAGAALLFGAAIALWRREAIGSRELATAGGVAAVVAGWVGLYIVGTRAFLPFERGALGSGRHHSGPQSFGWDIYLLCVSMALIAIGARARSRGMGYVGGFGLLAFLISVSAQVTAVEADKKATAGLVGWPLALLVLGLLGLAASLRPRRTD